jgi:hypothetical protein
MLESRYPGGAVGILPSTVAALNVCASKDPTQRSAAGGAP